MQRKRVFVLVGIFLIFDALLAVLYFQSMQKPEVVHQSQQPTQQQNDVSREPPAEPQAVYFVPVTSFSTVTVNDLSEVSGNVYVQGEYVEAIAGLSLWENIDAIPVLTDDSFFETLDASLKDSVAIIPLANVSTKHRILTVNGKSIFNTEDPWSIVIDVVPGHIENITPSDVYELTFGGTVVLSRGVAERIIKYNDPLYPWAEVSEELTGSDYAFINFKGAITSDCEYDGYTLSFCGTPTYLKGMADVGIDGVSVSGNHIGDFGQKGLRETIEYLDAYDIEHTGLGQTAADASKPIIATFGERENATTVGILAYNNVYGSAPCTSETQRWAVTCLLDESAVLEEITNLEKEVDIVVVYPNWGPEYTHIPHQSLQVDWGRKFVDAGADIVLGDQAHWVQTMEYYEDAPIFYGLGNFVFDQMWSDKTREGLLVKVYVVNGSLLAIEPIPTRIYDYAQVRIETGSVGDAILSYLTLPIE